MKLALASTWLMVALAGTLWTAAPAQAQDYVLGAEDVVTISVYLHPELERTVAVNVQGNVSFPPLGDVAAAGQTPKALGDRIADRLSSYLRQTTAVTVTVAKYMSRSIYVSGAVATPGRFGFERIPSLPEVIGQAGGAQPGADLSQVEIIRREGESRRSLFADVGSAMRDPNAKLPELKAGDTVVIPMGGFGAAGTAGGAGVGVLGEVAKPGVYPVGPGQDLWQMLAVAGGLTPDGDLTRVRVITTEGGKYAVSTINLREVLDKSGRTPRLVKTGDIVFVSPTGSSQFGRFWGGFQGVLGVARGVYDIVVIQQLLEKNP